MYVLGLDIGTSTVDAVVFTDKEETVLQISEEYNSSTIGVVSSLHAAHSTIKSFESLQNADVIVDTVQTLLSRVCASFAPQDISGIGISNQMHGIVYVDRYAQAVSPLYNWQDKRGDQIIKENKTYTAHVQEASAYYVPTGYGLMTHFYNVHNNMVPPNAQCMLDIGSYVISQLSKILVAAVHPSNAQSWGFYNVSTDAFDVPVLHALNINEKLLPLITKEKKQVGEYLRIPIFLSIGDNQAGVFGAIGESTDSVLINLGTSGQISFLCSDEGEDVQKIFASHTQLLAQGWERRPFINKEKLWVACSLCGGKTLDLWTGFIADSIIQIMHHKKSDKKEIQQKVYSYMRSLTNVESTIEVSPFFYGTREDPVATAHISKISFKNFTLEEMSVAMTKSIVDELYGYWSCIPSSMRAQKKSLLATGGSLKTRMLQTLITNRFNDLSVSPLHNQADAAVGAAKWALYNLKK